MKGECNAILQSGKSYNMVFQILKEYY